MHKEYSYPIELTPSRFHDKDYVVHALTRVFHLMFGLATGIGIGMIMCGVTKAVIVEIVAALGYLGTETGAWFYLPSCVFRLIRNDYPNGDKLRKYGLQKAIERAERLPDDCLGEKSGTDTEETPNITEMEDEKDGGIQSEDDGRSEGMV